MGCSSCGWRLHPLSRDASDRGTTHGSLFPFLSFANRSEQPMTWTLKMSSGDSPEDGAACPCAAGSGTVLFLRIPCGSLTTLTLGVTFLSAVDKRADIVGEWW